MYKVFINDKPLILCGSPDEVQHPDPDLFIMEVTEHESIRHAVRKIADRSDSVKSMLIYNNSNAKKLLDEFKSLFWYLEAAGGIVKNDDGKRLFIYRFGKWDLPKGKIEKGESCSSAALREVEEETGVGGLDLSYELPSTFHMYEHKGRLVFKRNFWFAMHSGSKDPLIPQLEEGITEARWIESAQLDTVIKSTYASLHELLLFDVNQRG